MVKISLKAEWVVCGMPGMEGMPGARAGATKAAPKKRKRKKRHFKRKKVNRYGTKERRHGRRCISLRGASNPCPFGRNANITQSGSYSWQ